MIVGIVHAPNCLFEHHGISQFIVSTEEIDKVSLEASLELGKVWLDCWSYSSRCSFFGRWCSWLRNSRATFSGWRRLRFCTTCRRIAGTRTPIHFIRCWNRSCGKVVSDAARDRMKQASNQSSRRDWHHHHHRIASRFDVFGVVDSLMKKRFQGASWDFDNPWSRGWHYTRTNLM